ncbi:MAG: PD-(D/E)XK nuclease family protein [Thermoanaerobaculaceae bacterium]
MSRVRCFASPHEAINALAENLEALSPHQQGLVVVPSRSLRLGLIHRLCEKKPAWAGVKVVTLQALARELLAAAGRPTRSGDAILPVVVHRAVLKLSLPQLATFSQLDRVGPLAATVRDLLDAGFTEDHLQGCLEALESAPLGRGVQRRAQEVLRLAAYVASQLLLLGVERRADALTQAAELLRGSGETAVGLEHIFAYGFADVTGVAGDFLEALAKRCAFTLYVVTPPDPVEPEVTAGGAFLERLAFRFGKIAPPGPFGPCPRPQLWQAPGLEAEIHYVAEDIAVFLESGGKPEDVAVVARDLGPYRRGIFEVFTDFGLPFSGAGEATGSHPAREACQELLSLLVKGEETEIPSLGPGATFTLKLNGLAFQLQALARATGVFTLGQLLQRGSEVGDTGTGEQLEKLAVFLRNVPKEAPPRQWGQTLLSLAQLFTVGDGVYEKLEQASRQLASDLGEISLGREEWGFLLRQELERLLTVPLGGRGAGVAVLSVMEARFRSFQKLYLVGMLRDAFPRLAPEDPFLPEEARQQLEVLLPDIPRAGRSPDEERYLFGLLLASAPEVRLSWPAWDEDGREQARSPYVDELLAAYPELKVQQVSPVLASKNPPRWGSPAQWLKLAGLQGRRTAWRRLLEESLRPFVKAEILEADASQIALARTAVLNEWEPPSQRWALSPSPYLGFLGSKPQAFAPAVTFWERYALCPWQVWLSRCLGILPFPSETPEINPAQVGSLVHAVLARIVKDALPRDDQTLGERLARGNQKVSWPSMQRLQDLCRQEAESVLKKEGIPPWPGLVTLLAQAAQAYLERAQQLLFSGGEGQFLAAEDWAEARIGEMRLGFRFDAVRLEDSKVVFLEYKTGKAAPYRVGHQGLLAKVRQGKLLQGAAAAVAQKGEGVYVFLDPSGEGEALERVPFSQELENTLEETIWLFHKAARQGVFFPRLWDPLRDQEPETCRTCSVRLACARGDAGVRRRLVRWGTGDKAEASKMSLSRKIFWLSEPVEAAG